MGMKFKSSAQDSDLEYFLGLFKLSDKKLPLDTSKNVINGQQDTKQPGTKNGLTVANYLQTQLPRLCSCVRQEFVEIFGPRKTGFSPLKILLKLFLTLFNLYCMQLFSANATIFSKNCKLILCTLKHKKGPQKLLIIDLKPFFTVLARLPKEAQN